MQNHFGSKQIANTHTHSEKQTWACTSGPSPPVVLKILVGFGRLIMAGTSQVVGQVATSAFRGFDTF